MGNEYKWLRRLGFQRSVQASHPQKIVSSLLRTSDFLLIVLKGPINNPRTIRTDFGVGLIVGPRSNRFRIPAIEVQPVDLFSSRLREEEITIE